MKYIYILAAVLFIALYYIMAEVIWQLRNRTFRRRLIIGVLIAALLVSQTSIVDLITRTDAGSAAAAEAENAEIITISDFAKLPEDIREQVVPVGTTLDELVLPDTLEAVCAGTDTSDSQEGGGYTEDVTPDEDAEQEEEVIPESPETGSDDAKDDGGDTETPEAETPDIEIPDAEENGQDESVTEEEETVETDTETNANTSAEPAAGTAMQAETGSFVMPEYRTENVIEVKTLEASSAQESIVIENITWQSEPEYDGDIEGEYIFTAVLPDGYILTNGVNTPQITVTVGETDNIALMSNDGIMLMASNEPPLTGGGTEDNPYKISSADDLKTLATFVNAGTNAGAGTDNSCSGMYFELTKDITLSGTWTPIGKEVGVNNNSFSGIFDGKNHTISGLNITVSQGQQGLFGVVKEGKIKNLNVKGTITGTSKNYYSVGGVVGYNDLGIIENCSFSGTISVKGDKAGGIAGYNSGNAKGTMGIIRNCTASGAVTGTQYVGGILGHNVTGTVQNCYNNCTVEGTYAVGGIVGYNAQTSIVSNSYNTCNVECNGTNSYGSRVGGIAGMNSDSTINNCYNEGTVTGNLDYVGGVAGYNYNSTVQNCYNRGTVTGSGDKVGGVIGDSTATNSYYLNTCGAAGTGESKTSAQFTSGEVTWLLQNGQSDFVWGQTLNSNNYPLLVTFTSSAKRVWKVTFMDGSTERVVKYVNDGNTITEPTDVKKGGYTAEWYTAQNGGGSKYNFSSAVKADLTLYVKWVENKCTVTFDANGGSASSTTQEYKIGETYGTLPTANRTGYTFDGWYTLATGGTKITATSIVSKDVTRLYAHWTADKYDITYKDQGSAAFSGTHESGYPTKHTYGTATTLKSASKTGYTFGGWYTDSSCMTKVTSLGASAYTSNITLYAKWTANQYTVSFNSAGGSDVSSKTVAYDSTYGELPTPTRAGYTFKGWYTGANGSGSKVESGTKVTTDRAHTLYAYWTGNPYEVTLKYQDGKTTDKKITATYGSTYGSALPSAITRPGYRFLGWFTQEEGGAEVKSDTVVATAQNHTLYARWKDETAPVIGELTYNYSTKNVAGYVIGNKNLTITVPVTEEGSGADKIEYTATAVKGTSKSGTADIEANGTAKFTVDADFEGSIVITCTDNAGNEGSKTVKVILEGNAPTVSFVINGSTVSGETDYYDVAPDVDVTVTDDMNNAISGGIASVTYQVDNGAAKTIDGDFAAGLVPHYSFAIPASEIPTGVSDITVKVEDNAGNTVKATLTVKVKGPEKTPDAKINYISETLTGLVSGAEYTVNEVAKTADADGTIPIEESWIGTTISVIKKGNGDTTSDSTAQSLTIPARPAAPSAPELSDRTDTSITLMVIPKAEYRISSGSWQSSMTFSGLSQKTKYDFEAYYPATQSSFCSLASRTATIATRPTPPTADKLTIDYIAETFSLAQGVEAFSNAGASASVGAGDVRDYMGKPVYIRYEASDDFPASLTTEVIIPDRPAAPTVTPNDATYPGAKDGKITGLDAGYTYEVSADGGSTWQTVQQNGAVVTGIPAGNYQIRIQAVAGKNFQSVATNVIIGEKAATAESTPAARVDHANGNLTGLTPGAEYDITYEDAGGTSHTEKVKADQNGNIHIEDDWTGKNVTVVKKGNGNTTKDSAGQSVNIPNKEERPHPGIVDVSAPGAKDGKITGLDPDVTYEISKDGGVTWEEAEVNEEGEITDLPEGSYKVRTKAKSGTLCSDSVDCKVGSPTPPNSDNSSSSGGDNSGGQQDNDGGSDSSDNASTGSVTSPTDETDNEEDEDAPDDVKTGTGRRDRTGNAAGAGDTGKTGKDDSKIETVNTAATKQNPESGQDAQTPVQSVQAQIRDGEITVTGDVVVTGTVRTAESTTMNIIVGEGAVIVTVVSDGYQSNAGVADTVAVANAVLTPEQIQRVNSGETIEIRVDVKDISAEVPKEDKDVIEQGLKADAAAGTGSGTSGDEFGELILGAYIDISMYIKVGDGDWDAVAIADVPIEIVIGIPDELQSDGRMYYIARCHEGEYALLDDLDSEPDTITIKTELFSTYAIAYRQGLGTDTDGANGFLASLSWGAVALWSLGILVMLGIVIFLIFWKRRKEEES